MALRENLGFRGCSYVELGVFLMGNNSRTGMNPSSAVEGNSHKT